MFNKKKVETKPNIASMVVEAVGGMYAEQDEKIKRITSMILALQYIAMKLGYKIHVCEILDAYMKVNATKDNKDFEFYAINGYQFGIEPFKETKNVKKSRQKNKNRNKR